MSLTNLFITITAISSLLLAGCEPGTEAQADAANVDTHEDHGHEVEAGESLTHSVSGVISGFDCAVVGEICPTTHVGADYTAGVVTDDIEYVFVVNIPQSFLQQHFRKDVEVEGTVYGPYDSAIEPEAIHVVADGERRLVYEEGYFFDDNGGRATFQDGVFENGRWVAPS